MLSRSATKSRLPKSGGGTEAAAVEPASIDIMEQPLVDAITRAAFAAPALGLPPFSAVSMDWKETPTSHVFMVDLPGLRLDEVKVEVEEEKVLKISRQRQRAAEEKGDHWHHMERSNERFMRTVRLPPNANTDAVQAALQDGVLTVTVPKDNDRKAYGRLIPITN